MTQAAGIRDARPGEAGELSGLAFRSKAHWGYSTAFMEACRSELAVTVAQIADPTCPAVTLPGRHPDSLRSVKAREVAGIAQNTGHQALAVLALPGRLAEGCEPCKIDSTYQTYRPDLCAGFGLGAPAFLQRLSNVKALHPDSTMPLAST